VSTEQYCLPFLRLINLNKIYRPLKSSKNTQQLQQLAYIKPILSDTPLLSGNHQMHNLFVHLSDTVSLILIDFITPSLHSADDLRLE
jgi:hypothetical protein